MKVSKIEKKDGIYYVTKTPNLIERLFGVKEKIHRYKHNNEVFLHFPHLKVYYKPNGEMVCWHDKVCKLLNNYENSFE